MPRLAVQNTELFVTMTKKILCILKQRTGFFQWYKPGIWKNLTQT